MTLLSTQKFCIYGNVEVNADLEQMIFFLLGDLSTHVYLLTAAS